VSSHDEGGGGASKSTEPASGTSAATDVSLREHLAQRLHDAERRIDDRDRYVREGDLRFAEERDRRYFEVAQEREKALKIKETADLAALQLAREIQVYKDEKANELREQINSERGLYLTREEYLTAHSALSDKLESSLKPLQEFVTARQGAKESTAGLYAMIGAVGILLGIIVLVANYVSTH